MIKKLFPIVFICLLWFIFSSPFFLQNKIPYPSDYQVNHFDLWSAYPNFWGAVKNPAMPDVISEMMPWKKLTIENLKTAQVPLWNPYSFLGNPHLANYQSASFSIINLFFFILNFNNAWGISVLIQPLLAGVFMYLFIKSLDRSEYASLLSSISFMFCGFITVWMSWNTLALAISFLPLALFAVERYSSSKQIKFLLLLSLTFPLSFFSGHFQASIYFTFYVLCFIFFKLWENRNKIDLLNFLSFSLFGLLLSAPQILPSIELYLQSFRSTIFQKINPMSISQLPTMIAPDFYGNPVSRNNLPGIYAEKSGFVGTIPFFIATYSLFTRSKKVLFFIMMAVISLALCLDSSFLDLIVKSKIPVISTSSLSRILVLFSFSISVLSAYGLDQLTKDINARKLKHIIIWIIIFSLLFLFLWISVVRLINPMFLAIARNNLILPFLMTLGLIFSILITLVNKRIIVFATAIIILLTSFDMLRFASKWQPFESKELAFPTTPIINKLKSLDNIYRTIGPFGAEGSVYYHIPNTGGYDPLYISRYGEFLESLNDGRIKSSPRLGTTLPLHAKYLPKVFDLLGIKYVLIKTGDLNKPWVLPIKEYPREKFKLIYKEKSFLLFQNTTVFPRAFLVKNYEVIKKDQEIVNKILNNSFDLRNSAVVEENIELVNGVDLKGNTKIMKYLPNDIVLSTDSDADSLLVLTDNFYPGWKAKIDGKQTTILRTDFTFRGVVTPKGKHQVEFYFEPKSFKFGIYLAIFSFICIVMVLIGKWYTNIWILKSKALKSSVKIADNKPRKNLGIKRKSGN